MGGTRNSDGTWTGLASLEFVTVGDPGNAADTVVMANDPTTGYGAVPYSYQIGKYEVTAGQYCEFLNAVAKMDTYGLYNSNMYSSSYGCKIRQLGSSGNYTYLVDANGDGAEDADWINRPVNYVSWGDAARFTNWLHNGQPRTGGQDLATTEDGSYYLNGATSNSALMAVTRKTGATWVIPTENEWYKAAYYDSNKGGAGVAGYWNYPMMSDMPMQPSNDVTTPDGGNSANFYITSDYTLGSPYWRTEVGEFENTASAYGTFDQGGNVWEWNETVVYSVRGQRGGSFAGYLSYVASSFRNTLSPSGEYLDLGFRVASVPEPGSLVMLAAVALTALLYWWRKRA